MNLSLPVSIFDKISLLEAVVRNFGHVPHFLPQAAREPDPLKQIQLLGLCMVGLGRFFVQLWKPFNPVLGETFQAQMGGVPFYVEQISHHPPLSAFLARTDEFSFHGIVGPRVEFSGLNCIASGNPYPMHFVVHAQPERRFRLEQFDLELTGVVLGEKKARLNDRLYVHEQSSDLFLELGFRKNKPGLYAGERPDATFFHGGVFRCTPAFSQRFLDPKRAKFEGLKAQDAVEKLSSFSGSWCGDVFVDGAKRMERFSPLPYAYEYPLRRLPSDSNMRLDVHFRKFGDNDQSQAHKELIEDRQRQDKKLRQRNS